MNSFTTSDKQQCAEREVKMRKRVYGSQIAHGRMSREDAEREIAMMQEIADDYRKMTELQLDI